MPMILLYLRKLKINKMRKLLLLFGIFALTTANAQETEFTFDNTKGMTDFIVTPLDGKTAPEIYKKIIEWIKITYKNPDKVILSTIENEYVRFEGFSEKLYSYNAMGQHYEPTKYQIEVSIKDGKYKLDIISMQSLESASAKSAGGWYDVKFFNAPMSKEELEKGYVLKKDGTFRSVYKFIPEVPVYFNNLNKSISESIISTVKKTDGW